jgi:hypothetical protein
MTLDPKGTVTMLAARVPSELNDFVYLAAAKLRCSKQDILSEALRQYREYLTRTGVLSEDER